MAALADVAPKLAAWTDDAAKRPSMQATQPAERRILRGFITIDSPLTLRSGRSRVSKRSATTRQVAHPSRRIARRCSSG